MRRPTKRDAAIAVSHLIDQFGPRLVIECVADYLRRSAGFSVWADRFDDLNVFIDKEAARLRRQK